MTNAKRLLALTAATLLSLAAACPLQTVAISAPKNGSLHDDPSLALDVNVGRNFVATSAVVRVDGVDLAAALGLTPPFADAAGTVTIGGDLVSVSGFTYAIPASGPIELTASLAGLSAGDHTLEAEAQKTAGGTTVKTNTFAVVEPFTLAAEVIASAGTPRPPADVVGNHAGDIVLGEPLAAPPVGIAGGGELRAGFVPAVQARTGTF